VPKVELTRRQHETAVAMAGIGYGYDLEELGKATHSGAAVSTGTRRG
jgi:hypothetical protein